MDTQTIVIVTITLGVGFVLLVSLSAIFTEFIKARRERTLLHAERMKALELGRPLPESSRTAQIKAALGIPSAQEVQRESPAGRCFSTAFWVAFWGFIAAAGNGAVLNSGVSIAIAAATGAIGVTAVICGTILTAQTPAHYADHSTLAKPVAEEDAYDVVASRG